MRAERIRHLVERLGVDRLVAPRELGHHEPRGRAAARLDALDAAERDGELVGAQLQVPEAGHLLRHALAGLEVDDAHLARRSVLDPVDRAGEHRAVDLDGEARLALVALDGPARPAQHLEVARERARHRLPYGARILADEGAKVTCGDRLAEWDPYMLPIIAERDGVAHFVDLVDGVSIREVTDEETGISSRVVVDWRQQTRGADLKPLIALRDANGDPIELAAGIEARYFLSVDAVLNISDGAEIKAGDVLARIPRESTKTRDITGGLPRVAELFEARRPKDHAVLAESAGRVEFGRDYKTKRRIIVRDMEDPDQTTEYMIPKGRHVAVREGDMVEKGDLLLDGNPAPHDILNVLGVEALAEYLVQEIQSVYRLQGVKINDKHIEVIVRQMLQKIEIPCGLRGADFISGRLWQGNDLVLAVFFQIELHQDGLALAREGDKGCANHVVAEGFARLQHDGPARLRGNAAEGRRQNRLAPPPTGFRQKRRQADRHRKDTFCGAKRLHLLVVNKDAAILRDVGRSMGKNLQQGRVEACKIIIFRTTGLFQPVA